MGGAGARDHADELGQGDTFIGVADETVLRPRLF